MCLLRRGACAAGPAPCSGPARWRVATVRRGGGPPPASGCGPRRPPGGAAPAAPQGAQLSRRPVLGSAGPLPRLPRVPTSARTATLRDAVGLGAAVGLYGVAFGAAAVGAGLPPAQALGMSLLMFTGASQFALVGVLGAGGGALAAVGSALLLGSRNTVYGVRLVPLLKPRGVLRRLGTAHWVIDETTALSIAAPDRGLARLAFW